MSSLTAWNSVGAWDTHRGLRAQGNDDAASGLKYLARCLPSPLLWHRAPPPVHKRSDIPRHEPYMRPNNYVLKTKNYGL